MNLNVENAGMFLNLSAFAVPERIKGPVRRAENRKAINFFPLSHP
jgi:hypothetical protein